MKMFFFENTSLNADDFNWAINAQPIGTAIDLGHSFPEPGIYEITLLATNDNCSDLAIHFMEVRDPCGGPGNNFQKILRAPDHQRVHGISPHPNGGYLLSGNTDDLSDYSGTLVKTDEDLEVDWVKTFSDPSGNNVAYHQMAADSNDHVYLSGAYFTTSPVGYQALITKMDENGQVLWHLIGETTEIETVVEILPLPDGNVLTLFQNTESQSFFIIAKLTPDGDVIWQKPWEPPAGFIDIWTINMISGKNDEFFVGCLPRDFNTTINHYTGIIKFDSLGNPIWFNTYRAPSLDLDFGYSYHLHLMPDGGLVFSVRTFHNASPNEQFAAIRTDADGEVLWAKRIDVQDHEDEIKFMVGNTLTPSGNFVMTVRLYPNTLAIYEFTPDGTLAWNKYYSLGSFISSNFSDTHIISEPDGLVIGLSVYSLGNWEHLLMRTNSIGDAGPCNETDKIHTITDLPVERTQISASPSNQILSLIPIDLIENTLSLTEDIICQPTTVAQPDAQISFLEKALCQGVLETTIEICNTGGLSLPENFPITLFPENPTTTSTTPLGTITTDTIVPPNECIQVVWSFPNPPGSRLFAVANENGMIATPFLLDTLGQGAILECNTFDNMDSLSFQPYQAPLLILGNDTTVCSFDSTWLFAPSGFREYLWSDGSTDTSYLAASAGVHWLEAMDSCGMVHIDSILIELALPAPPLDLGPDIETCITQPHTFDAGDFYEKYQWQNLSANSSFTAFLPGTYWVDVWDACGNHQSDTVRLTIDPTTEIDIGADTTLCADGELTLNAGNGFNSYQWSPNIELDCDTCQQVTLTPTLSRTYVVQAQTEEGCQTTDTIHIEVSGQATFGQLDTTVCANDTFAIANMLLIPPINETIKLTATNGCDSFLVLQVDTFTTYNSQSTTSFCDGDSVLVFGNYVTQAGSYTEVFQTINGCDSTFTVIVEQFDTFVIMQHQFLCEGDSVLVFGNYENEPAEYRQIYPAVNGCDSTIAIVVEQVAAIVDTQSIAICEGDSTLIFGNYENEIGEYIATFPSSAGCDSTQIVQLGWHPPLFVSLPDSLTITIGESQPLNPVIEHTGNISYQWSPSTGLSCTDCEEPLASPIENTLYTLTVSDDENCSASTSILILVKNEKRGIYVPTVFSPNGDTANDQFTIYTSDQAEVVNYLRIFDRWGGMVFEAEHFSPSTHGWDGTFNGKPLNPAVFAFVAEVLWKNGEVEMVTGSVTLVR